MKTNQETCSGNVYVNYCCPNGGSGSTGAFKGTNVYVDCKNTNQTPDGSINNPFVTLKDAFDYVDAVDESYVVHVINTEEYEVKYTFRSKGNLGIVGNMAYNIQEDNYLGLNLRFQDIETILCVDGLRCILTVYGGKEVYLNDILSSYITLYDTGIYVRMNNCRNQQGACYVNLAYESNEIPHDGGILANLLITNSIMDLAVNRRVYYAWANNSNFPRIHTDSNNTDVEALIQLMANGCFISQIENTGALASSYFTLTSCFLNDAADIEKMNISGGDILLNKYFETINYTPSKNSILSHLEAIDAKLGELQAKIGA